MKKHRIIRILAVWLAVLSLCITLASCSASKDMADMEYNESAKLEPSTPGFGDTVTPSTSDLSAEQRKIIKTYHVQAETKDFDAAITSLHEMVAGVGGYVEKASTTNKSLNNSSGSFARYANYTVRIPAENADAFVGSLGTLFNVTSNDSQVEDISETYYGIEARLEELRVERDSLLDILDQTETKQDYDLWLTVKQRLSEVTQQIAVYQGQINRYDSKVAYSTVTLSIREVLTFSETGGNSFGSRLGAALRNGWSDFFSFLQDFTIWLAGAMPFLILLAIPVPIVILIIRRIKKRRRG